ncbi:MAG TPA: inositol oxygenase family protein [Planctomycetaceae bacterium]|jgi:hypothetical protein|nr:inositol oxygenase family protein [Planctomycetaceae bacterium]
MSAAMDSQQNCVRPSTSEAPAPVTRRQLLNGAICGSAALATGGALAYKFRASIDSIRATLSGRAASTGFAGAETPAEPTFKQLAERAFHDEARRVYEEHRRQTVESVAALKRKYEQPVFGRMRVWDLIEKLGQCVDVTDYSLCGASQWLHVCQALAAMEQHGVTDPDLFLIALIHDLGKVFLLAGEVPENVCCTSGRLGEGPPGMGLDQVVYQFGHGELIYSRVKDLVPEHVAWTVRYHNIDLNDAEPFMNDRDREYAGKYLDVFRTFDRNFKSIHWIPQIAVSKYRDMVQHYFPKPILF